MAGQPIIRGHLKTLEDVGEEAIINMVLEGETVRSIIQTLGVGMRGWYKWMDLEEGRRDRFDLARQMRAEALDQEGLDLVDNCDPDRDEIQLTKLRVEQRRHIASVIDRSRREKPETQVNLSIGSLHLSALKENMQAERLLPDHKEEDVVEGEYEVVEDD
jgi:hypothetical protein